MEREKMNIKSIIGTTCACLTAASFSVNATMYDISSVLQGNDGGYQFSSFHDANDDSPMSGTKLADITGPVISGSYDDVSGAFDAVLTVSNAGPTVTLSGNLLFVAGILNPSSTLSVDFDGSNGFLSDTSIGFLPIDVCCNGTGDPNSFKDIGGVMTMSLWGASWDYGNNPDGSKKDFDSSAANPYSGSELGMDLRIQLTAVPVPAAVWLFGSGLIGLVGFARRK
jgi:hypothetical protein